MTLTEFAGSPAPNAIGTGFAVLLAVVSLGTRDRLRWLYAALALSFAAVVLLKNFSYNGLVSGVEGSPDAHRSYADALLWIVVAQVAIGVIILVAGMTSKRLLWLATAAALGCGYAAVCMNGWREAYLALGANQPVKYQLWTPPLHWVLLIALAVSLVLAAVIPALARSRRTTTTP